MDGADAHFQPYKSFTNTLKKSLHPANIGVGLATGLGAQMLDTILPNSSI